MGDGFYFIEIVIFAMIAAFLVYRLRSVLGRRHGEERQRPPVFSRDMRGQPDNVVHLPDRNRPVDTAPAPATDEPQSLAARLTQIHIADPSFDEKRFLQGAGAAFQMIVEAFAKGDTATLRPLLADEVYDSFAAAIRDRTSKGETLETRIEKVQEVEVSDARMDGRTAYVTVRVVSDQVNVLRSASGEVLDGDANVPAEVIDLWTFARNTRSQDPNWQLVETRTGG